MQVLEGCLGRASSINSLRGLHKALRGALSMSTAGALSVGTSRALSFALGRALSVLSAGTVGIIFGRAAGFSLLFYRDVSRLGSWLSNSLFG